MLCKTLQIKSIDASLFPKYMEIQSLENKKGKTDPILSVLTWMTHMTPYVRIYRIIRGIHNVLTSRSLSGCNTWNFAVSPGNVIGLGFI